jgi:membrane-associated protease RseP (regulator of RpoE activity)
MHFLLRIVSGRRRISFAATLLVSVMPFAATAVAQAVSVGSAPTAATTINEPQPIDGTHDYLLVWDVDNKSAAARAGILAGDVILQFGGMKITSQDELFKIEGERYKAGDVVEVIVFRAGKQLKLQVTLTSGKENHPVMGAKIQPTSGKEFALTAAAAVEAATVAGVPDATAAESFQLPDKKAHTTAQIGTVTKGGPAARVGLIPTDVILQFGRVFPQSAEDITNLERKNHKAGDVIELTVLRHVWERYWKQVRTRVTLVADLEGSPSAGVVWKNVFVSGVGPTIVAYDFIPPIEEFFGANETQLGDIKRMREIRTDYIDMIAADWPTEAIVKKKGSDGLGCEKVPRHVEVTYANPGGYLSYARVEIPVCDKNMPYLVQALLSWEDGSWQFGSHYYNGFSKSGGLDAWGKTMITSRAGKLEYDEHGSSGYACIYAHLSPGMELRRMQGSEALTCGGEVKPINVTAFVRDFGSLEGEHTSGGFSAINPATVMAPDGSWKAFGHIAKLNEDQVKLLHSQGFRTSELGAFDASVRFDTTLESSLGPAGTYLTSGLLPAGELPPAGEVQPAPGLLAKYANAVEACPYQAGVPEGWLPWAPNCKTDTIHFDAWAVDGSYRMRFTKGQPPILQSFTPEHPGIAAEEWHAASFTNTQPPAPIGDAELWQNGALAYRGTFAGLEPEGAGQCGVDESSTVTEPCKFAGGKRVDALYLARKAQRSLDDQTAGQHKAVAEQLQANAADRARIAEEKATAARLRAEAEAETERAEKQAKSDARAAMFGAILTGVTQGLNEVSAQTQAANAAAAQANAARQQANQAAIAREAETQRQLLAAATQQRQAASNTAAQQRAALAAQQRQAAAQPAAGTTAVRRETSRPETVMAVRPVTVQSSGASEANLRMAALDGLPRVAAAGSTQSAPVYHDAFEENWQKQLAAPKTIVKEGVRGDGKTEADARQSALQRMDSKRRGTESEYASHVVYGKILSVEPPICYPVRMGPTQAEPTGAIGSWYCQISYSMEVVRATGNNGVIAK